jgi:hypothetical protein
MKPADVSKSAWEAAEEPAQVCFDGAVDLYETGVESSNLQLVIARAIQAATAAAYEDAARVALEQRCERKTPWDAACVAVSREIRARASRSEGE